MNCNDRIILCQPDSIKGCSLCCGLFNFTDISKGFLQDFLEDGRKRESLLSTYGDFSDPVSVKDRCSHICPYQGFINQNKPGCLVHPYSSGSDGRGRSLFASKICGDFFCPAHTILSDPEKIFLIKNVDNWYLYSIAIADPEGYSFIYKYVTGKFIDPSNHDASNINTAGVLINEGLTIYSEHLADHEGIIFCYSIPEYNINKKNFSIRYSDKARDMVISRIEKTASALL